MSVFWKTVPGLICLGYALPLASYAIHLELLGSGQLGKKRAERFKLSNNRTNCPYNVLLLLLLGAFFGSLRILFKYTEQISVREIYSFI